MPSFSFFFKLFPNKPFHLHESICVRRRQPPPTSSTSQNFLVKEQSNSQNCPPQQTNTNNNRPSSSLILSIFLGQVTNGKTRAAWTDACHHINISHTTWRILEVFQVSKIMKPVTHTWKVKGIWQTPVTCTLANR